MMMTEQPNFDLGVITKYSSEIAKLDDKLTPKNRAQRRELEKQQRSLNKKQLKMGRELVSIKDQVMTRFVEKLREKEHMLETQGLLQEMAKEGEQNNVNTNEQSM